MELGVQQAAVPAQVVDDALVGLEHLQPLVGADGLVEAAVGLDRRIDVEPVGHAGVVVVLAVARARCARSRCPGRAGRSRC